MANIGVRSAINVCGSQTKLGEICGVTQQAVYLWLNNKAKVSVEYIPKIMLATNFQVTPEELRPDVDWAVIKAGK